jgi:hypothetical protein
VKISEIILLKLFWEIEIFFLDFMKPDLINSTSNISNRSLKKMDFLSFYGIKEQNVTAFYFQFRICQVRYFYPWIDRMLHQCFIVKKSWAFNLFTDMFTLHKQRAERWGGNKEGDNFFCVWKKLETLYLSLAWVAWSMMFVEGGRVVEYCWMAVITILF